MRQLRLLYLYWNLIPSIRLCGHCQLEWLAKQGRLEYRHSRISQLEKTDLAWADAVLLGRLDSSTEYHIARQLKEAGKYLIYVIDDDLLQVPPGLSSAGYYGLPDVRRSIQRMIGMSDAILSPSPILLKKYAADGRRAITIEEPALDPVAYAPHDPSQPVRIGFAGSVADAFSLCERFEQKLEQYSGSLSRASVALAQDWRSDKIMRKLEALLIVADKNDLFVLSGTGEVIDPDDGIAAIGSGGMYALAAARALLENTELTAAEIAKKSLTVASEICVYTNGNIVVEEV